jgi:hypothetical protein
MKDIVINCPCESHKEPRTTFNGRVIEAKPKILFVASAESVGEFKTQCPDGYCKKYNKERSKGKYNSWYKIVINSLGGYSVEPLPKQEFELEKVPFVVIGD